MSGHWGKALELSIFGESHGPAIGISINGLPAGLEINRQAIDFDMQRRAPGQNELTTSRKEDDQLEILSGVFQGHSTGAPLTAVIYNQNQRSKDYSQLKNVMRPGHADYSGRIRYHGFHDYRGGGHFSGRLTAPLVFAGSLCQQYLSDLGVSIGSHIQSIDGVEDQPFDAQQPPTHEQVQRLKRQSLPTFDSSVQALMANRIRQAREDEDSVGGVVEVFILGLPAGIGNPFFDSIESTLAHLVFSVPATKGIEFGDGFHLAQMKGSEANDSYFYDSSGQVQTRTNHNGGILGGISIGQPISYRTAIKAPASIKKEQATIDIERKENTRLHVHGRHDPCIVPRVLAVLEAVTAIGLTDLILSQGSDGIDRFHT